MMNNFIKSNVRPAIAFLRGLRNAGSHLARHKANLLELQLARQVIRAEHEWKDVFDTITDMVTIHDVDFNIIDANKAAKHIFGLPRLDTGGVKCFRYYHGSESPPEGCPSCSCFQTGQPVSFESYEPHLKMFIEIRAIPRFDRHGNFTGLVHIVRDITRRKRVEEELQVHRDHLEWLVRERTAAMAEANLQLKREIHERQLAEEDRERLITELQEAIENIKTLRGLLPMCAWCNRIRDEAGSWKKVDIYLTEHTDASFTHGICPECVKTFDEDLKDILNEKDET